MSITLVLLPLRCNKINHSTNMFKSAKKRENTQFDNYDSFTLKIQENSQIRPVKAVV